MTVRALAALTLGCALSSAVVSGIFFAFSTFVMKALARLAAAQGIAAMQAINVAVINAAFMTAFLGTGVGCVALAVASILRRQRPEAIYLAAGALLYLVGVLGVTSLVHVPENDALAAIAPDSPASARLWSDYLSSWTAWNHVRTAAALAAAATFTKAWQLISSR